MATPTPYFLYPFASSGNATTIPSNSAGNAGAVSYEYGFTPNYEGDLSDDATALPVPRLQFNQLMLDITSALQYLQTYGAPLWVAPAAGDPPVGGPVNYPLFARVGYNPGTGYRVYESQVSDNTSVPGANTDWLAISSSPGYRPGMTVDFAGPNEADMQDFFETDGSAKSRVTYINLFNALTLVQGAVTNTGTPTTLTVDSSARLSIGINAKVEGAGIPAGTYIVAVLSPTSVQLSANVTASGSITARFFIWGNGDGSTTFNIPLLFRQVITGAGGEGNSILGGRLGQSGGADDYKQKPTDLAFHNHPGSTYGTNRTQAQGSVTALGSSQAAQDPHLVNIASSPTGIAENQQTSMNIIQQSTNLYRYIKY